MTRTSQAAGEVRDGEDVPGSGLDAIERMYDETMASIADMAVPYVEPWPATEEIDVAAIEPPVPSRRPSTEPDPASNPLTAVARPAAMECAAVPRRPWHRWFSFRALGATPAR
jgi:hypothetical protein